MKKMDKIDLPITNLVLEGGGVKGIAYVGALEVLDELKKLAKIKCCRHLCRGDNGLLVSLRYLTFLIDYKIDTYGTFHWRNTSWTKHAP